MGLQESETTEQLNNKYMRKIYLTDPILLKYSDMEVNYSKSEVNYFIIVHIIIFYFS